MLARAKPQVSEQLLNRAQEDINDRWHFYEQMAGLEWGADDGNGNGAEQAQDTKETKA
jgi:hypothetical protein